MSKRLHRSLRNLYYKLGSLQNIQLIELYNFILMINNYNIYKLKRGKGIPSKLVKISDTKDLPYHNNLFCFLPRHLKDIPKSIFV